MPLEPISTKIKVEGTEAEIIFSGLQLSMQLADVCNFSFTWRQEARAATQADHIRFYTNNFAKVVQIKIGDNFTFKGIIKSINCTSQDSLGVYYQINGSGLPEKLNYLLECNTFYKKKISEIFTSVNTASISSDTSLGSLDTLLHYTAQYNQTSFSFLRLLATRFGLWYFYDGEKLNLRDKSPEESVDIDSERDLIFMEISASIVRPNVNAASYNRYTGTEISHQGDEPSQDGFTNAAIIGGKAAYGEATPITAVHSSPTEDIVRQTGDRMASAMASSAVNVRGSSRNPALKLANTIDIKDAEGASLGRYIITELYHRAGSDEEYINEFVCIPADAICPPYTNPSAITHMEAQLATVTDNEDEDGLDRIKVHFAWQAEGDKTPWINVVSNYAGKGRGIRFIPEIDDVVMIGFEYGDVNFPFVLGAVNTEKTKSGRKHESNKVKSIGTKIDRQIYIDDESSMIGIVNNDAFINLSQGEQNGSIGMEVGLTENSGAFVFIKKDLIEIGCSSSNAFNITLDARNNKIIIDSGQDIEIKSVGKISMKAQDIEIVANNKLTIEGMEVKVEAQTNLSAKGAQSVFEGAALAKFKGGGMATLEGGIVMIN